MPQAIRKALEGIDRGSTAHAGLLLARYLETAVGDKKEHPRRRLELLTAAQRALNHAKPLYTLAYDRRMQWLAQVPSLTAAIYTTMDRMIIGLGSESALETGLTLHHTYGVPVIPGSALKGLAAHYCDQVWGNASEAEEYCKRVQVGVDALGKPKHRMGRHYKFLFGSHEDAGYIQFFDAWITPDSIGRDNEGLVDDVMTPHHGDYYGAKDDSAPTDYDEPTPIRYLAVRGTFQLAVSCELDGDQAQTCADLALDLLTDALKHWGIGGKTSSGYGRLVKNAKATERLKRQFDEIRRAALPNAVRVQAVVAGWLPGDLAIKLGKKWNLTLSELGIDGDTLRGLVLSRGDANDIRRWKDCGEGNKEKAWKRIFGTRDQGNA